MTLVLSSSSPARKDLLNRLMLAFEVVVPDIDETPLQNETAQELVIRLAIEKAKKHAKNFPNGLIIGSDQVGLLNGKIIGKPENHEKAVAMLLEKSEQIVNFYTGLCLYNTKTQQTQTHLSVTCVKYKKLSRSLVENYLRKEKPYHCTGSIKVEGLGIALMEKIQSDDPTSLTGLPLIALVDMLEKEGVCVV